MDIIRVEIDIANKAILNVLFPLAVRFGYLFVRNPDTYNDALEPLLFKVLEQTKAWWISKGLDAKVTGAYLDTNVTLAFEVLSQAKGVGEESTLLHNRVTWRSEGSLERDLLYQFLKLLEPLLIRFQLSVKDVAAKKDPKSPVYDPVREMSIFDDLRQQCRSRGASEFLTEQIIDFFNRGPIKLARDDQEKAREDPSYRNDLLVEWEAAKVEV